MVTQEENNLISESEFAVHLGRRSRGIFKLMNLLKKKPPETWVKRYYSVLAELALDMESYLDDYHARYNKTFGFITELSACLKWFGHCGSLQKHILMRFPNYSLKISNKMKLEFNYDSQKTLEFFNRSILILLDHLETEAIKLELPRPKEVLKSVVANSHLDRKTLPQNLDEKDVVDQAHILAELATLYKNIAENFKKIRIDKDLAFETIKDQTFYEFDETKTRQFESQIHNIQSKYDTYIKNTILEAENPSLTYLRGFASLSLHLFEMATILVHFYERHENDIRYQSMKQWTSTVIPKEELLRILNGYVRYYGVKFLLEGEKYVDEIIGKFVEISTITVSTRDGFSLHARPLSLIAKIALHYNTMLEIEIGGQCCNAGSIMQMILLAGSHPQPREITFRGEGRALRDVKDLFETVLSEPGETNDVPPRLAYLFK